MAEKNTEPNICAYINYDIKINENKVTKMEQIALSFKGGIELPESTIALIESKGFNKRCKNDVKVIYYAMTDTGQAMPLFNEIKQIFKTEFSNIPLIVIDERKNFPNKQQSHVNIFYHRVYENGKLTGYNVTVKAPYCIPFFEDLVGLGFKNSSVYVWSAFVSDLKATCKSIEELSIKHYPSDRYIIYKSEKGGFIMKKGNYAGSLPIEMNLESPNAGNKPVTKHININFINCNNGVSKMSIYLKDNIHNEDFNNKMREWKFEYKKNTDSWHRDVNDKYNKVKEIWSLVKQTFLVADETVNYKISVTEMQSRIN